MRFKDFRDELYKNMNEQRPVPKSLLVDFIFLMVWVFYGKWWVMLQEHKAKKVGKTYDIKTVNNNDIER